MATHAQPPAAMKSTGSAATLDLQDLLSSCPSETLVSTSLGLIPSVSSTHSFDDVAPFPASAKPLIFVNELGSTLLHSPLPTTSSLDGSRPLLTCPTGPRLKVMLMEAVSVKTWACSVLPQSGSAQGLGEDIPDSQPVSIPLWISEGSMFSPEQFRSLLSKARGNFVEEAPDTLSDRDSINFMEDLTLVDLTISVPSSMESLSAENTAANHVGQRPDASLVPTIMVSNSTAALPLSLESSHSLHPDLPLAVRRGKKPPPALSLGPLAMSGPSGACDSYPDIPTPFLGSPTSSTLATEQSREVSKFDVGLSRICSDLRSRLPSPPPFTPTEPLPPLPRESPFFPDLTLSSQDTVASDLDDEEWSFAKDLVTDWYGSKARRMEVSPPPSPAGTLPYASDIVSRATDADSEAVPSTPESSSGSSTDEEDEIVQTPVDVKLMRRKTVIIQAPDSGLEKAEKTEKVLSLAAEVDPHLLPHDFEDPVPFETPTSNADAAARPESLGSELSVLSPPGSRPASTASVKPVRGILKEKKSVRFSTVDMFHEYHPVIHPSTDHSAEGVASAPITPVPARPESMCARRLAQTASVHKNSPLRESYAPAPTLPAAAQKSDAARWGAHSPATRAQQPVPPLFSGRTMAKHPAVRALAHAPSVSSPLTPSNARPVGSGAGGVVVGAPSLQGPTPVLLKEQRRAPLRSINAHQSLPADRKPVVPVPVKPTRRSMLSREKDTKAGIAPAATSTGARRGLRAASIPPSAAARHERDENARRRSQPAKKEDAGSGASGRGRMSAPLRSILTKLRA